MKSTKKSLIASALSLVLCVAMLLGTTYAWFTDSVTSGKNKIVAGNLDVELKHYTTDATSAATVKDATDLFGISFWEPGVIAYENFIVSNEGNLALKYALNLNVFDKNTYNGKDLTEVIKVAVVEDGFTATGDPAADRASAQEITTYESLKDFQKTGNLAAKGSSNASDTYGVVLYWEPTDHDNDYNVNNGTSVETSDLGVSAESAGNALFVEFGVNLVATQDTVESDAFDKYYDEGTAIAVVTNGKASKVEIDATPDVGSDKPTTVEFEDGAFTGNGTLEITLDVKDVPPASHFSIKEDAGTVASIDLNAVFNGLDVSQFNGKKVTVTTYIAKGLNKDVLNVVYTGEEAQPTDISYDSTTGKLVFSTTHFSEYLVTEDTVVAYDIATKKFYNDLSGVTFEQNSNVIILKNLCLNERGITFKSNTTSKLDLNGYSIFGIYNAQGGSALITNNGTLTVCDNTDTNKNGTGGGKITTSASKTDLRPVPGYASNVITNKGALTVESGLIYNAATKGGAAFAIDNYSGSEIYFKGGMADTAASSAIRLYRNETMSKLIKAEFTGGFIHSAGGGDIWVQTDNKGPIQVLLDGVTCKKCGYDYAFYEASVNTPSFDGIEWTVKSGLFESKVYVDSKITISGGTFNLGDGKYVYLTNDDASITGGTFNTGNTGYVYLASEKATITGGTFTDRTYAPWCIAGGYIMNDNADGSYTVVKAE